MKFRNLYVTLLLLLSVSLSAFSQSDTVSINTIMSRTAKFATAHPYEKVYLHFDKPYYAVGDTIWFKAYVTIDVHQPSPLSKIVYVDIINAQDSLVQSMKLQVTAGANAFGNVTLTSPLYKQGNYHFRAYTNWMRNDDPTYFFNKTIAVGATNNQIITGITLSGSTKANTSKVAAKVIFKDPAGKPYAGKKVNWKALNDDETIGKGKGVTSANGVLDLSFTTNKTSEIATCNLVTEISVSDEKTITNSFPLTHAVDQPDVQFFPEGGNLIAGIRSRVAVKAVSPSGLGVNIRGTITDNAGTVVAEFTSQHLGMGVFALQPDADKSYKANVTFPDGTQASYNLPKVQAEGMTLSIFNTDPASINVKLSANPSFFQKNQNKRFYIIGQNGEVICYAAQAPLQNNVYSASIPKNKFPSGVTKFTLFNDHGEPLAERVTFILRNDLLNLTLKTAKTTYAPRQKVTVNVSAMADQKPAEANLSVTVIDETKVPYDENSEITILTHQLLTSDLKGYIEKPNYYFNHPDDKTVADMDALMLTQGYTRFLYKDVIVNKFAPITFLPEQGISISGTLRNSTGLPIPRGNMTMVVGDRASSVNTIANAVGEFKFTNLMYPDSTKLTFNAKGNPNGNSMMILLDNTTFQKVTPNITAPDAVTDIDSTMSAYIANSKKQAVNSHVLTEVNIRAKAIEKKPNHADYPSLMGLSMEADQTITGDRLTACPFLAQCLQSAAFGLTFQDNKLYVSRTYNSGDKRPVEIYYNGMAVDFNYLQNVNTADVESVEVFLNDGMSGINKMDNTNGVLVVNSKVVKHVQMSKADIMAVIAASTGSAVSSFFRGYTPARVFYSPKYDPAKTYSLGGDLRTTVYWNPKILTDKTGAATFEFFNADSKGTYRAIIEGIDANGNLGRTVYRYTIQ
jgi:hypothetical protein